MKKIFLLACILFAPLANADEGCGENCVPKPGCTSLGYKPMSEVTCADGYIYCPFDKSYVWCRQYKCSDGGLSEQDNPAQGKSCVPQTFHGLNCFDCSQDKVCRWTGYNADDYGILSGECGKGTYTDCTPDYVNIMQDYPGGDNNSLFVLPENAEAIERVSFTACGQTFSLYTDWKCKEGYEIKKYSRLNTSGINNLDYATSPVYYMDPRIGKILVACEPMTPPEGYSLIEDCDGEVHPEGFIFEQHATETVFGKCTPKECPAGYVAFRDKTCSDTDFVTISAYSGNDACGTCKEDESKSLSCVEPYVLSEAGTCECTKENYYINENGACVYNLPKSCEEAKCSEQDKVCQEEDDDETGETYYSCRDYQRCSEIPVEENDINTYHIFAYVDSTNCSNYNPDNPSDPMKTHIFISKRNIGEKVCGICVAKPCEDLDLDDDNNPIPDSELGSLHTDPNDEFCSAGNAICTEVPNVRRTWRTCYRMHEKYNFTIGDAIVNNDLTGKYALNGCGVKGTPCAVDFTYTVEQRSISQGGTPQTKQNGYLVQTYYSRTNQSIVTYGDIQKDADGMFKAPKDYNAQGLKINVTASLRLCDENKQCALTYNPEENTDIVASFSNTPKVYNTNGQHQDAAVTSVADGSYLCELGMDNWAITSFASFSRMSCEQIGQKKGDTYYNSSKVRNGKKLWRTEDSWWEKKVFHLPSGNITRDFVVKTGILGSDDDCYRQVSCHDVGSYKNTDPECNATGYKCIAKSVDYEFDKYPYVKTNAASCYVEECADEYKRDSSGNCVRKTCSELGEDYVSSNDGIYHLKYENDPLYDLKEQESGDETGQCYKIGCRTTPVEDEQGKHYYRWDSNIHDCVERPVCILVHKNNKNMTFQFTNLRTGSVYNDTSGVSVNGDAYDHIRVWKDSWFRCLKDGNASAGVTDKTALSDVYIGDQIQFSAEEYNGRKLVFYRLTQRGCSASPGSYIGDEGEGEDHNIFDVKPEYGASAHETGDCPYLMMFYLTYAPQETEVEDTCEAHDNGKIDTSLGSYHSDEECNGIPRMDGSVCASTSMTYGGKACYEYRCDTENNYHQTQGKCCPQGTVYSNGQCTSSTCSEQTNLNQTLYTLVSSSGDSRDKYRVSAYNYNTKMSGYTDLVSEADNDNCYKISCAGGTVSNEEPGEDFRCNYQCGSKNGEVLNTNASNYGKPHYQKQGIQASKPLIDANYTCYNVSCTTGNVDTDETNGIHCECDVKNDYFDSDTCPMGDSDKKNSANGCWKPNCRGGQGYFVKNEDGSCGTCNDCPDTANCNGSNITCHDGYEGDDCSIGIPNNFYINTNIKGIVARICDNESCNGDVDLSIDNIHAYTVGTGCQLNKCQLSGNSTDCSEEPEFFGLDEDRLQQGKTYWLFITRGDECDAYNQNSIECENTEVCSLTYIKTTNDKYVYMLTPRNLERDGHVNVKITTSSGW